MKAIIQDGRLCAVGEDDARALRAALMLRESGFDPDRPCVIAPAVVVDQALGRVEYKQERR